MTVFNWYLWSCGVWRRQNRYVCAVGPSFKYLQTRSLWKPLHVFTCHISKGKGEVVLVHAMKPNWQVDKHIHSFLVLPLHSIHSIPSTQWTGCCVGSQRRSEHFGGEKNALALPGIEPIFLRCPAYSVPTIKTELCKLPFSDG